MPEPLASASFALRCLSHTIAPRLGRRMACWLYEGILMFGVVFIAGYLFGTLSQTRNALDNRHALQAFLFVVFGIYFTWFWARADPGHENLAYPGGGHGGPPRNAGSRTGTLCLELALVSAPTACRGTFFTARGEITVIVLGWVAVWALSSRLHPQQQFWHDAWAGTRLVDSQSSGL